MTAVKILASMDSRAFFGAERANLDILWRMRECGAEVFALIRHEDWPGNLHMRAELEARGIGWIKAPFPEYPSSRYRRFWPKVVLQFPFRYLWLNAIAIRTIRKKGITNLHLGAPFQAFSFGLTLRWTQVPLTMFCVEKAGGHNWFFHRVWLWLTHRVDLFVCESRYICDALVAIGADQTRIMMIRTSPPRRLKVPQFVQDRFNEAPDRVIFAFVGQFSSHKGIAVLLDAFALVSQRCPGARLMVAGPVDNSYARSLVDAWSGYGDGRLIWFCGALENIPGFLAEADVHVAPTIGAEPYGLVVVEAKRAARPSILFNDGGMVELIENGQDGLVAKEKTAAALAREMMIYAQNRDRARADGQRARASLSERLDIDQQNQKWLDAYAEAQCNRRSHR